MRFVSIVALILFLFAAPFLYFGFGGELWTVLWSIDFRESRWISFSVGAMMFIPSFLLARRLMPVIWEYIAVFEHELAHLLVGFLFLKVPISFKVSAHKGGEVKQIGFGTTGETWITLAPYFLPTFPLFLIALGAVVELDEFYFYGALGWLTVFHIVTNWSESSFRQPDLKKAGVARTILIVPLMNLISQGSILAFVSSGSAGFLSFLKDGFVGSGYFARDLGVVLYEYALTFM